MPLVLYVVLFSSALKNQCAAKEITATYSTRRITAVSDVQTIMLLAALCQQTVLRHRILFPSTESYPAADDVTVTSRGRWMTAHARDGSFPVARYYDDAFLLP